MGRTDWFGLRSRKPAVFPRSRRDADVNDSGSF